MSRHLSTDPFENIAINTNTQSTPLLRICRKKSTLGIGISFPLTTVRVWGGAAFGGPCYCGGTHKGGCKTNAHTQWKTTCSVMQIRDLEWLLVLVVLFSSSYTQCNFTCRLHAICLLDIHLRVTFNSQRITCQMPWDSVLHWLYKHFAFRPMMKQLPFGGVSDMISHI